MSTDKTAEEATAIKAACDEFNIDMDGVGSCEWPTCGCTDDGGASNNPMVGVARRVLRALKEQP